MQARVLGLLGCADEMFIWIFLQLVCSRHSSRIQEWPKVPAEPASAVGLAQILRRSVVRFVGEWTYGVVYERGKEQMSYFGESYCQVLVQPLHRSADGKLARERPWEWRAGVLVRVLSACCFALARGGAASCSRPLSCHPM